MMFSRYWTLAIPPNRILDTKFVESINLKYISSTLEFGHNVLFVGTGHCTSQNSWNQGVNGFFLKLKMIRPDVVYNVLLYLKENHCQYKDIDIPSLEEWEDQYHHTKNSTETSTDSNDRTGDDSSDDEDTNLSGENAFNSITCLLPENPLANVIVNTSD